MTNKHYTIIAFILIILFGFIIYHNSLFGQFLWDDEALIKGNVFIKSWLQLPKIFTQGIEAGVGGKCIFYRPVLIFTLMIDYSFWKLNVFGYHLATVVFHILASLALFHFIFIIFNNRLLAFLTSFFFLIHPIQTEDVAYITGRADSLALLFLLLSFTLYVQYKNEKNREKTLLLAVTYSCALFSKENAIILPALIFLFHYSFRTKFDKKRFFLLVGLAIVYLAIRSIVLKSFLTHVTATTTPLERLPSFFAAVAYYIRLMVFPFDLHMAYGHKLFSFFHPYTIIGVLTTLFFIIFAFIKRKENPLLFFGISWFFIGLLPVSNIIIPASSFMAERYLYIPSIGIFLIFSQLLVSLLTKHEKSKVIVIFLLMGLVIFYCFLTVRQNSYWKEPISFYKKTLSYEPQIPELLVNLGTIYCAQGKFDIAQSYFEKALAQRPNDVNALINLGNIFRQGGKTREAISFYKKAIEAEPTSSQAYYNLGIAYTGTKQLPSALAAYQKAIEINPDYAAAYNNLGLAYENLGRYLDAFVAFNKAVAIDPFNAEACNNLGVLYIAIGKNEKASQFFKKSIASNPNNCEAYYNLALLFERSGECEKALEFFKKALLVDPQDIQARYRLAKIYIKLGQYAQAVEQYDRVVELGYSGDPEISKILDPYFRKQ